MTIIKNDKRPTGDMTAPAQLTRADLQTLVAMRRDVQDDLTHKQPAEYALTASTTTDTDVARLSTANVFTQSQTISKASGTALLNVGSVAGTARGFGILTGAALRWLIYADTVAEGGANAGSNFNIARYNDAGTALSLPVSINRASGITTLAHALNVTGPVATAYVAKTAAYTITAADSIVAGDATGGAFNVTLPTAVGITGRAYTVKRINSAGGNVTVACTGGQTIDGAATLPLTVQWQVARVVSDGANWLVV